MAELFAYIPHNAGVAEDIAMEYPEAAKKIDGRCLTYRCCHRFRCRPG